MAFGKDSETATTADVERQIEQLREDIATLTQMIGSLAAGKAEEVKEQAMRAGSEAAEASANVLEAARDQVCAAQSDLEDRIRAKPLQSLGIAVGVGFFLALITRRA